MFIKELIIKFNKNEYELLFYNIDLIINLINIFKIIDKWNKLNDIDIDKNENEIMLIN